MSWSIAIRSYRSGHELGSGGISFGGSDRSRSSHTILTAVAVFAGVSRSCSSRMTRSRRSRTREFSRSPKSRSMPWNFSAACRWTSMASTWTPGIPAKSSELGTASVSVACSSWVLGEMSSWMRPKGLSASFASTLARQVGNPPLSSSSRWGGPTAKTKKSWFGRLNASDDALEHHASTQPVQADPTLGGRGDQSMLQRGAQRLRRLVDHGVSAR